MSLKDTLKEFTREDTSIEHFNGCPAFTEMTTVGFSSDLYGGAIPSYRTTFSLFKEQQGDYCALVSNQDEIGKLVIRQYQEDPGIIESLYKKWLANFEKLVAFYPEAYAKDFQSLSDEELLAWSERVDTLIRKEVSMPGFIDSFMFYAERRFGPLLAEFCEANGIPDAQDIQVVLSAPTESSFLNEEEEKLYGVARALSAAGYKKGELLAGFLEAHPELRKAVEEHLAAFSWIKGSYVGHKRYTLEDFEAEVQNALAGSSDGQHSVFEDNARNKEALLAKFEFSPEILAIVRLTELLVKWQDQRKNYTLFYVALRHRILEEVARRTGTDFELLRYSLTKETASLLAGNLPVETLKEREKGAIFTYVKGENTGIYPGAEAIEFFRELSNVDVSALVEVKGTIASKGNAKGPARIVLSIKDIEKVQEGEILVTSMTRPEHVPAMRKAAAIVTDDGGITCHAAIVSRELKKPCIIGTKIATKVFKDGDMVEVDANTGVARKA